MEPGGGSELDELRVKTVNATKKKSMFPDAQ